MKLKKILSGPFVWIFIAIGVLIIGSSLMGGSGFKQVDTKTGLEFISSGKAKSVQIMDADQRVDVTLVSPDAEFGELVQFYYVGARAEQVGVPEPEMRQEYLNKISLKRMVTAEDVAAMALFLCSPAARNVTGQAISVDGNVEYL